MLDRPLSRMRRPPVTTLRRLPISLRLLSDSFALQLARHATWVRDPAIWPRLTSSRVPNSSITTAERQRSAIGQAVARCRPLSGAVGMLLASENPPESGTEPPHSMFPEVAGREGLVERGNEANSTDRAGRRPVNGRDCACHGSKWSCHWRISAGAVEPQSLRLLWLLRATWLRAWNAYRPWRRSWW